MSERKTEAFGQHREDMQQYLFVIEKQAVMLRIELSLWLAFELKAEGPFSLLIIQ